MVKIVLFLLVAVAGAFYFWTSQSDSSSPELKTGIADMFSSSSARDDGQVLAMKREELKAYEGAIKQVDGQVDRWKSEADAKICPQTGQKATFQVSSDPRPELQEKINRLRLEIAELEQKTKQ